jgi:hypothetical protein
MKPRVIDTTSKFLAGIQIKLTFLQILLEHHPRTVDFDLARERIALPDTLHWNLYGLSVRELQIARLIQEDGVTRSTRPIAKGGKRSIWKLADPKRAAEWVKAFQNILPVEPQGRLFEQGGGL